MIGGPVYAVAQHQNQVSKEGGGKKSSSVCWESKAKVSNRQHALTDEWVMGYQNIAAVFILLPRMEQTVEEQKKKNLNKRNHVQAVQSGQKLPANISCSSVSHCFLFTSEPPHPPPSPTRVKIQALACRRGKNNSPLVLTAGVEHAVMVAVGGARAEGKRSHPLPVHVPLQPLL